MPTALHPPDVDDLNRPFWDGCARGRAAAAALQRLRHLRYPISPVCPRCLSTAYAWDEVSGGGEVYSFGVFRHAYNDAWRDRRPYAVAIVRLDEGPFMIANLVDLDVDLVRVGLPVSVYFDTVTPEVTIPRFTA